MTTWPVLNTKLNAFIGKPPEALGRTLKNEPLRIHSWNWAQRMFVNHTPLQRSAALTIESDGRTAILPSDIYSIQGIYDASNEVWWKPQSWEPGDTRYTDNESLTYWWWGDRLHLEYSLETDQTDVTLYYWAYYPDVEYTEDAQGALTYTQERIYTPDWAELALMHLTIASVEMPLEIESADISQWKLRIESGNPEHNPRAQSAWFHLRWYETLIGWVRPARGTKQ